MKIFEALKSITANGTANLIEKAGNALDGILTSKEELISAKAEIEKIVLDHAGRMETLRIQQLEAELKDVDSARRREMDVVTSDKAPLINKVIQPIIAIGTITLTFLLFYFVLFGTLGSEKDIIIYILGALTAITGQVFSYYFGSSTGSKEKSDRIDKMINK